MKQVKLKNKKTPDCLLVGAKMMSAIAIALVFASCGGGNTDKQQGGNSETTTEQKAVSNNIELKDISESNWQAVLKSNFGIDYVLPAGWSFKEAYSSNQKTNLKLFLNIGGETTGEAMGKILFEKTKALSPHGNYKGNVDWDNDKVAAGDVLVDFGSANTGKPDDIISKWNFTFNKRMIMINYYAAGKIAEYTFTLN